MTLAASPARPASTVPDAARPGTSALRQWWVLTARVLTPTLRNGEVLTQVATSIMFTAGYYIPLKQLMGQFVVGTTYAQYLMPLIALQAVAFAAVSAAFRSASDAVHGINRRFSAMPIGALTPLASRLSAAMYRCLIALVTALVCGHVIGFRFHGDWWATLVFCALMLGVGVALSLVGDLIGSWSRNPEATVPVMLVPQLFFGLLSTGMQPVERFPDWIQGFVRNQPISQFVYALRDVTGDSDTVRGVLDLHTLTPALLWIAGIVAVTLPLHLRIALRRP